MEKCCQKCSIDSKVFDRPVAKRCININCECHFEGYCEICDSDCGGNCIKEIMNFEVIMGDDLSRVWGERTRLEQKRIIDRLKIYTE